MSPSVERLARQPADGSALLSHFPGRWRQRVCWLFVAAFALGGCGFQKAFVIDTGSEDPLIASPYQNDDGFLRIPIPSVRLSCSQASVKHRKMTIVLSTKLGDQLSHFSGERSVVARISRDDARDLANAAKDDRTDLTAALKGSLGGLGKASCTLEPGCVSGGNCGSPSEIAAETILRNLPVRYSSALSDRYNHQLQKNAGTLYGVSFDLSAGMRLRIENSLPISPAGFGAIDEYPSSFAAPTYLYVHALTGSEICDANNADTRWQDEFICGQRADSARETDYFLSLSSGMARWGTRQVHAFVPKKPPAARDTAMLSVPLIRAELVKAVRSVPTDTRDVPVSVARREVEGLLALDQPDGGVLSVSLARSELDKAVSSAPKEAQNVTVSVGRREAEELLAPVQAAGTQDLARDASGLIDLLERSNAKVGARRHWRLWIPASRPTAPTRKVSQGVSIGASAEGDVLLPMLISADSLEELDKYDYGRAPICHDNDPGTDCFRLRYRVVPIPEVLVRVNGEERWVPVGSTLLDLVAHRLRSSTATARFGAGNRSSDAARSVSANERRALASGLRVRRMFEGRPVAVRPSSLLTAVEVDRFLRLQIVAGDEIEWK